MGRVRARLRRLADGSPYGPYRTTTRGLALRQWVAPNHSHTPHAPPCARTTPVGQAAAVCDARMHARWVRLACVLINAGWCASIDASHLVGGVAWLFPRAPWPSCLCCVFLRDCVVLLYRYSRAGVFVPAEGVLARMQRSTNVEHDERVAAAMSAAWDAGVHDRIFASPITVQTLGFEWTLSEEDHEALTQRVFGVDGGRVVGAGCGAAVGNDDGDGNAAGGGGDGGGGDGSDEIDTVWAAAMFVLRDRLAGWLHCSVRDIHVDAGARSTTTAATHGVCVVCGACGWCVCGWVGGGGCANTLARPEM